MNQRGERLPDGGIVLRPIPDLDQVPVLELEKAAGEVRVLIVDTETTGTATTDRVVEVAYVLLLVDTATGAPIQVGTIRAELDDPGVPIPSEATAIHGITDDLVQGKRIDEDAFRAAVMMADWVVAHVARFDRGKLAARFPWIAGADAPPWACSCEGIDWKARGHKHRDLETLVRDHGGLYAAHRATEDVQALAWLLTRPHDEEEAQLPLELSSTYFRPLLDAANAETWLLQIGGRTFDAKEEIKALGFVWDDSGHGKRWLRRATREDLATQGEAIKALARRRGLELAVAALPLAHRFDEGYEPPVWKAIQ